MGMRFPMGMGIPWEWEFVTKLGMGMGKNGKQPVFPSADAVYCIIIIGCTLHNSDCFCIAICRHESSASDDNFILLRKRQIGLLFQSKSSTVRHIFCSL